MTQSRMNHAWGLGAAFALMLVAAPRLAHAQAAEGEMLRFLRQAEAFYEHNSNRNVFRSSRHFHPTRNVMRSSRHYEQRVAASHDGYPVRSFGQFTETIDGLSFVRSWDYAHPRGDRYRVRPGQASRSAALGARGFSGVPITVDPGSGENYAEVYESEPMYGDEPVVVERPAPTLRPATQRAVMEQITRPDGTVATIIRSVPIEGPEDEAAVHAASANEEDDAS